MEKSHLLLSDGTFTLVFLRLTDELQERLTQLSKGAFLERFLFKGFTKIKHCLNADMTSGIVTYFHLYANSSFLCKRVGFNK